MSKPTVTKEVKEWVEWYANVVLTERQRHFNNVIGQARDGEDLNYDKIKHQMSALTELVEIRLDLMRLINDQPVFENNDHEDDGN